MAGVDTSFYGSAPQQQQTNPLQMYGQIVGIQNAQNQNKLFGQEFAARRAMGPIIQQATDPNTGVTDYAKVNALMAGNPATAFLAPSFAKQGLDMQASQASLQAQQLANAKAHTQLMGATFGALAADPNLTPDKFIQAGADLIANSGGAVKPSEVAGFLQNLPGDPATLRHLAVQQYANYKAMEGQLDAAMPKPTAFSTGDGTQIIDTNPLTNPKVAGQFIANRLSPQDKTQTQAAVGTNGAPGTIPVGAKYDAYGNLRAGGQANTAPAGAAATSEAQPSAPAVGGAPNAQPAPGAPANPHGFTPTGLAPGVAETASENAKMGVALQSAAEQTPARRAIMQNMESELTKASIGPGTGITTQAKAFFGMDKDAVAARMEFQKNAIQLAQQQAAALGSGTDAKLDAALHSNPNTEMTEGAARYVLHTLKGNEDAINVKNLAWQKAQLPVAQGGQGMGPQDYGKFSADFNKSFDPRIFQMQYMSKSEKKSMLDGMNDSEKARLRSNIDMALKNGWVSVPGQANGR